MLGHLLLFLLVFLVHLLLFPFVHLAHATVFGLFVDLLHVVPWRKHLVLRHAVTARSGSLLALPLAFLGAAFVEGSVELIDEKKS